MASFKSHQSTSSEGSDDDDSEMSNLTNKAMTKDVKRLTHSLSKPIEDTDLSPHVSTLHSHYSELDAEQQEIFLSNVFAQLLEYKSQKYQDNVSGLLTGR